MKKRLLLAMAAIGFCAGTLLAVYGYPARIVGWKGTGSRRNTTEWELSVPSPDAAAVLRPGTAAVNSIGDTTLYVKDVISQKHGFAVTSSTTGVTPDYVGQMVFGSDKVVYIATAANATSWQKIGAQ